MSVVTHEILHSFGFPHTRGVGGGVYNDPYDVMSHAYSCGLVTAQYGCLPQGTSAYYRSIIGWIGPQAVVQVYGGTTRVTLNSNTLLAVVVPLDSKNPTGYAIEVREKSGIDSGIPAGGVIIHQLNFGSGPHEPVLVTNMRGSVASTAGDVFVDQISHVEICVTAQTGGSYSVVVVNGGSSHCTYQSFLPDIHN